MLACQFGMVHHVDNMSPEGNALHGPRHMLGHRRAARQGTSDNHCGTKVTGCKMSYTWEPFVLGPALAMDRMPARTVKMGSGTAACLNSLYVVIRCLHAHLPLLTAYNRLRLGSNQQGTMMLCMSSPEIQAEISNCHAADQLLTPPARFCQCAWCCVLLTHTSVRRVSSGKQ